VNLKAPNPEKARVLIRLSMMQIGAVATCGLDEETKKKEKGREKRDAKMHFPFRKQTAYRPITVPRATALACDTQPVTCHKSIIALNNRRRGGPAY